MMAGGNLRQLEGTHSASVNGSLSAEGHPMMNMMNDNSIMD